MSQDIINHINHNENIKSQEVISIPVPLAKSIQGKYFIGQTKPLFVRNGKIALAGLVNPRNSGVYLYANVFTISNFSDDYLTVELWLNTDFPKSARISHMTSPTNTALRPFPKNKVNIKAINSASIFPTGGVNVYERIVPPNTTLVSEEDGKFIHPPGGNYSVVIKSSSNILNRIIVAFGWWEEPIKK